jgi:hypothetical protein
MHSLILRLAPILLALLSIGLVRAAPSGRPLLQFDGLGSYVEVPDSADFSVGTSGGLTVSAWLRPDTLQFPTAEGSGYVYWLGKGERSGDRGDQEWALRIYSQENTEGRANRISFYVFNRRGGLGIGSYFQDPVVPGEWIHVVAVADGARTAIYKNGVFRQCDQYYGAGDSTCQRYAERFWITPEHGGAPLRLGTQNGRSFFAGALADVRIWSRALDAAEIAALYSDSVVPSAGLVAEWRLDEGAGTTAHDSTGAHDGLIVNAIWTQPPEP